jgi:hypothetical protein
MNNLERSSDDVDWSHLGQNGEEWLTLVNTAMNIRIL